MRAIVLSAAAVLVLAPCAPAQELASDVPPLPRGSISGLVRSVTGEGLGHLQVRLRPKRVLNIPMPDGWTGPDGTFEIKNIPAGAYTIELRVPGFDPLVYGPKHPGGAAEVVVRDGRVTTGITFEVPVGGTIRGMALTTTGEPAAHAMVWVARRDGLDEPGWVGAPAFVGSDGRFTLSPVKEGDWFIALVEQITDRMIVDGVIPMDTRVRRRGIPRPRCTKRRFRSR